MYYMYRLKNKHIVHPYILNIYPKKNIFFLQNTFFSFNKVSQTSQMLNVVLPQTAVKERSPNEIV